jgi:hypothetical protein
VALEPAFDALEIHRVDHERDVRAGRIDPPIRCGKRGDGVCQTTAITAAAHRGAANVERV